MIMVRCLAVKEAFRHQPFQDSVPIRKPIYMLGHPMCSLDAGLEEEIDQMKITTSMVIPVVPTLHTKSDSGW